MTVLAKASSKLFFYSARLAMPVAQVLLNAYM
jgi:hypothetical protein